MAEFPALPLWTDAYLGDTTHLTTIEHGAYLLLLMTAWRTRETRLPDDDRLLARYARCGPNQWKRLRPILEPFFLVENGFWVQRRLTDEASAVRQRKEAAAANGRASALKRKGRHSAERQQSDNGNGAERQRDFNLTNNQYHTPLSKDNGAESDKAFWDSAKAFLGSKKASLIGRWCSEHGQEETAKAITAAQIARAVDPVEYVQGYFRKHGSEGSFSMEAPIC
jgi:uncharacterized protein YdaU (DUF1376 family)